MQLVGRVMELVDRASSKYRVSCSVLSVGLWLNQRCIPGGHGDHMVPLPLEISRAGMVKGWMGYCPCATGVDELSA